VEVIGDSESGHWVEGAAPPTRAGDSGAGP
jgi:hypothetical protein